MNTYKKIRKVSGILLAVMTLTLNAQEKIPTNHGDDIFPDDLFLPDDRIKLIGREFKLPESRFQTQAAKGIGSFTLGSELRLSKKTSVLAEIGLVTVTKQSHEDVQPTIYVTPYTFAIEDQVTTTHFRIGAVYRLIEVGHFVIASEAGFQLANFSLKSKVTEAPLSAPGYYFMTKGDQPGLLSGFFTALSVDIFPVSKFSVLAKIRKDFISGATVKNQDFVRRIVSTTSTIDNTWKTFDSRKQAVVPAVTVELGIRWHM